MLINQFEIEHFNLKERQSLIDFSFKVKQIAHLPISEFSDKYWSFEDSEEYFQWQPSEINTF